jgi:hypothetical protein
MTEYRGLTDKRTFFINGTRKVLVKRKGTKKYNAMHGPKIMFKYN